MAAVIDAKRSTFIGAPDDIIATLQRIASMGGKAGSVVMDISGSNFVVLNRSLTNAQLLAALAIVPTEKRKA